MSSHSWADITRENVISAINRFKAEKPEYPMPKSYYLLYDGEKLPAKHIRGMAYEEAFGDTALKAEYVGGVQTQKFFERLGFVVVRYDSSIEEPEGFDSWTIISDDLAVKKCDKSFFDYRGSGIPIDIRWFFGAEYLKEGERVNINLVYREQVYPSYVSIAKRDATPATRIFWNTELGNLFNEFKPSEDEEYPEVEFERVEGNSYFVTFYPEKSRINIIDIDYIGVLDYLNSNQEVRLLIQYLQKLYSEMTADAQKKNREYAEKGVAAYKKGTWFTAKKIVKVSEKEYWAETPSGYVCLMKDGTEYVK